MDTRNISLSAAIIGTDVAISTVKVAAILAIETDSMDMGSLGSLVTHLIKVTMRGIGE
ncbi:hypothetical protein [Agrobacterium sp. DSM 25558]|uniref:hypothetical protein n=1 Tax=Agrobacterium sp. DSM 25558 TaxID=1907665 RepID=UPI001FCD136D|nr:hypothetical protein [Agrobacterium sp. DSM 25558]